MKGNISAQYNLGCCYRDGQGAAQDYVEAAKWYRRAAEQGDMVAQSVLGAFYADGTGVPKNKVEAYMALVSMAHGEFGFDRDRGFRVSKSQYADGWCPAVDRHQRDQFGSFPSRLCRPAAAVNDSIYQ